MVIIYYSARTVIHMPQIATDKVYQHLCICGYPSLQSTEIAMGLTQYVIAIFILLL